MTTGQGGDLGDRPREATVAQIAAILDRSSSRVRDLLADLEPLRRDDGPQRNRAVYDLTQVGRHLREHHAIDLDSPRQRARRGGPS
jgi:hypothetical protein